MRMTGSGGLGTGNISWKGATRLPAAGSNVVCSSQSLQLPVRKELTASTSKVSLRRRERLGGLPIKLVASVLSSASMETTCQAEQQTIKDNKAVVSKAPLESKDKAFTPKLDDGGTGGGLGGGGEGGGGGGGGGGGSGGFLFWGLLMLIGFIRDNEKEKPYRQRVNKRAKRPKGRASNGGGIYSASY